MIVYKQRIWCSVRNAPKLFLIAALLSLVVGTLAGCKKEVSASAAAMPALPVSVVKIEPKDVAISNEWVGTMDGYVNAQIQPQASGYLVRQLYAEGSRVEAGAGFFEIDTRPFLAVVGQTEGKLSPGKGETGVAP